MKKIIVFFVIVIIAIMIFLIFFNNMPKNNKIGNNSSSQEIVDYILNISSYELKMEVNIKSNKNSNKYILKQQYIKPDISTQEVIEPANIAGVKIIKNGNELKIKNTNLNLITVFNNYEYISENVLDLNCFIEDYNKSENAGYIEKDNQIIMETKTSNMDKKLYIDKVTAIPTKMEIKDNSKKSEIYILYNEVNINNFKEENILAFEKSKNMIQV